MRQTAFNGADQHHDRELESFGPVNGHQGNAVPLFPGFVAALLPALLDHITDESKEARHRIKAFSRSLQLVQHFFNHFLMLGQQLPLIRFDISIVEFLPHLGDGSGRLHGR
ncbi:hypothetical protein D3C85_1013150 [compost metagenome]